VLWDVESGRPVRVFVGHANALFGMGYLAGKAQSDAASGASQPLLVTGSFDRTLRVWYLDTGVTLRVLEGHLAGVPGVAVHTHKQPGATTQVFSASNDGTVRRWEIAPLPRRHLVDLPGEAWSAAIGPDGSRVAVGFRDGSLRVYALPEGRLLGEVEHAHDDLIVRLVFDAEGAVLASASRDGSAKLWSIGGDGRLKAQQTFTGHNTLIHAVAFSSDGKTLATASYDGRVGLFKVGSKEEGRFFDAHAPGSNGGAESVAFDTNETRLFSAGYYDKTAPVWDLTTDPPKPIREFKQAQAELLWAALSPDDRLVATVGRDQVVDIYKTDDGQLIHRLVGHEQAVYRANFSPDGRQLATVSSDATVRLWDLDTGAQLFALRLSADRSPPVPARDFDFRCTPNGCWVAVPLTRGKLALYDLGPYAE
jgi:WD40 repeat protein